MMTFREDYYEDPKPVRKPKLTIISLFIWLGLVTAFGMLIVGLSGCAAPQTFTGTCAFKILGVDEHGNTVALTYCESAG